MPGIYLEPVGLLYGQVAKDAMAVEGALPLAGGPIAFGAVRLWEGEPGTVSHAIVRTATIQAIDDPQVKEMLDRITAPRPPLVNLTLDRPRIMGVVNVTPDSFSDGGDHFEPDEAVAHAHTLVAEGADLIDIGGESTRPGSEGISAEEEHRRVLPVVNGLADPRALLSIDTRKPEIMRAAAAAGAAVWNDVSALTYSAESPSVAAALGKPVILMHAQGDPKTMQVAPAYGDVVMEVYDFLEGRIAAARQAGVPVGNLVADPGIGFGKTIAHNLALLRSLTVFHGLGVPLMLGTSRKGFLKAIAGDQHPKARMAASVASAVDAVAQGVHIVRVHDVKATRQALSVWLASRSSQEMAPQIP